MEELEKKLTKEYIQQVLSREDIIGMHAIGRALILLNQRQTIDEQMSKEVHHHNLQGFSPYDANLGTDMANFYSKTGFLTPKQLGYWRKKNTKGIARIAKYWRQLLEDAKLKHGIVDEPKARSSKRPRNKTESIPLSTSNPFPTMVEDSEST